MALSMFYNTSTRDLIEIRNLDQISLSRLVNIRSQVKVRMRLRKHAESRNGLQGSQLAI